MYRVRLTSGEETAFRSVEELALGIQSGVITGEAEIYHSSSQRWLPISVHPEYTAAAEQASERVALSTAEAGPVLPDADVEVLLQAKVPIYKMVSVSAREIEARRRPRWIEPVTTGVAALIFVGAIALASALGGRGADIGWSPPNAASSSGRLPATNRLPPARPPGSVRPRNPGPAALARQAATAQATVAGHLGQRASQLGMQGLVNHQRLATPDSLRAVRQAVAAFRPAITQWRNAEVDVVAAYRDTASALARSGRWDPSEFTEWRARAPGGEPIAMIRTTDSLLLAMDRAYTLLQESGQIDSAGNLWFAQTRVAAEYDRLRATVSRLAEEPPLPGERVPPPLVILRGALGGKTFPAPTAH